MIAGGIAAGMVQDRLARIRRDAGEVQSVVEMVRDLRNINPFLTPILDLRRTEEDLRWAADVVKALREEAELVP